MRITAGGPKTLIVDGFNRTTGSYKQFYHDFVTYFSKSFTTNFHSASNKAVQSGLINLNDYEFVIWFLGDESTSDETFDSSEQEKVKQFLREGGKLFVTGSEVGYDLFEQGSSSDRYFFNNYLKSGYVADNSASLTVNGEIGTIFSGLSFNYGLVSAGAPYNEDYPDALDTLNGSQILLRYSNNKIAAVGCKGIFEGGSKNGGVILAGFPFETIIGQTARTALMSKIIQYFDLTISVAVENNLGDNVDYILYQNYPNPFNSKTRINYFLPQNGFVELDLFDVLGRKVRSLVSGEKETGYHYIDLDIPALSSGIYFYNLYVNNKIFSKKMVIMK